MGVAEIGVFIHKAQLNEHRSQILLHGVDPAPIIGDIKVGMGDKRHAAVAVIIFI